MSVSSRRVSTLPNVPGVVPSMSTHNSAIEKRIDYSLTIKSYPPIKKGARSYFVLQDVIFRDQRSVVLPAFFWLEILVLEAKSEAFYFFWFRSHIQPTQSTFEIKIQFGVFTNWETQFWRIELSVQRTVRILFHLLASSSRHWISIIVLVSI